MAPEKLPRYVFVGELGLDGRIKPTTGILPIAAELKNKNIDCFFVPHGNAQEAAMVDNVTVYAPQSLQEIIDHLNGAKKLTPVSRSKVKQEPKETDYDFCNIHGQVQAKRALEIAAAGGHNIIMSGPPGSGKTLLARSLSSILPPLTTEEQIEVSKLYSISGLLLKKSLISERPFRSPHHTSSHAALVGGGSWPRPGEITLAHRGVLFLDELPEFPRGVLETLRQPLEDHTITICRTNLTVQYPAQFMLVAAMNPCPCGYKNDPYNECSCTMFQIQNYQKKISGPLLDRIDMQVHVPKVQTEDIMNKTKSERSSRIARRVASARIVQRKRYKQETFLTNAELPAKKLKTYCNLTDPAHALMYKALTKLNLSARSYSRMVKVARTIADLDNSNVIEEKHLAEGMRYRF